MHGAPEFRCCRTTREGLKTQLENIMETKEGGSARLACVIHAQMAAGVESLTAGARKKNAWKKEGAVRQR